MRERVEPDHAMFVEQAAVLADELPELDARELLHAAVPRRLRIERIISADPGLDRLTEVERLDPTEVEAWREHESEAWIATIEEVRLVIKDAAMQRPHLTSRLEKAAFLVLLPPIERLGRDL